MVIKVWGLSKQTKHDLEELHQGIVAMVVVGVSDPHELGIKVEADMIVLFPAGVVGGLGSGIFVEVSGLNLREVICNVHTVRKQLADCVGRTIREFYPETRVMCCVYPADSDCYFWTSSDDS